MTTQRNHKTIAPTYIEKNGAELPNKTIAQTNEKTWDGPLGEAIRQAGTGQGYVQPEAVPRTETVETGNQQPLSNPDEAQPQTQKPTVIQQPVAAKFEQLTPEETQEKSVEHSEQSNVNHQQGYNEIPSEQHK